MTFNPVYVGLWLISWMVPAGPTFDCRYLVGYGPGLMTPFGATKLPNTDTLFAATKNRSGNGVFFGKMPPPHCRNRVGSVTLNCVTVTPQPTIAPPASVISFWVKSFAVTGGLGGPRIGKFGWYGPVFNFARGGAMRGNPGVPPAIDGKLTLTTTPEPETTAI